MLVGQVPEIDLKKLPFSFDFVAHKQNPQGLLELSAVETRQKELYELIKYTWTNQL